MLIASAAAQPFSKATDYLPKGFPSDARLYLDRRLSCDHWASEGFGNYTAAEQKKIKRSLAADHCERLDRDEKRLKEKYARNAVVIRELNRQD
jgi:hypothetical protein